MKQIIMALAITAFAYTSAEAKICTCKTMAKQACTASVKHKTAKAPLKQESALLQSRKTVVASCRLVPYDVCKINADRKSVSCFKSIDPDALTPLYPGEVTTYGATGKIPGQAEKPAIETIIIKSADKVDYCKRNDADNATICYHNGALLTRDHEGFYHY